MVHVALTSLMLHARMSTLAQSITVGAFEMRPLLKKIVLSNIEARMMVEVQLSVVRVWIIDG